MKNFEERLNRLEELSDQIQEGQIGLEDAVSLFEEGIKISKALEKDLSKIERKIEILINQPETKDDKPEMELFPELNED
ncbi:MAG: exodeoxyribonuclease VII small subunit [Spirochaetales bacterium]|nr:exodeoxyribonuclease VII small subunit [Spirochaetales bacterium]